MTTPTVAELVAVKPLEWHKSHIKPWLYDYHTIPTAYTVRCADENGWRWSGFGAHGYCASSEGARAAAQSHHNTRILAALSPAATEPVPTDKSTGWLIWKDGRGWYRPDAQGYTNDVRDAGRYSHEEAIKHSHPNGPNGPRDGMTIKHESEVATPPSPVTVEAALAAARELIDGAQTTYRARNGRQMSLEADDGERCYIVHSDLVFALTAALRALAGEKRDG